MPEHTSGIQATLPDRRTQPTLRASPQRSSRTGDARGSRVEFLARLLTRLPMSVWAIMDATSVCLGNYLGYQLFHVQFPTSTWVADMTLTNAVVALCYVVSGVVVGLYQIETLRHRSRIAVRSLLTVGLAIALSYVVMHALLYEIFSRRIAIISPLTFIAISGGVRLLAVRVLDKLQNRVLFVGCGESVRRVCEAVGNSESASHYTFVGYVSADPAPPEGSESTMPFLGDIEAIESICQANDVHEVVIGAEESSGLQMARIIMRCLRLGCRVTNQPTFHERVLGEVPTDHITADWFLFADLDGHGAEQGTIKRTFDFCVAALGLLVTLPLWPVVALAIKLSDGGPIFYSQRRVGYGNRVFKLIKFRTMRQDAEADGHAWAVPRDPRITAVGRILRRYHLDELPQLWNIFLGDMSVVGPRPERPEFVENLVDLIPYYDERHLVKPGLTGWAQVNYRYGASIEDARRKLCLDLYYIKHMSIELDLVIIFRTLGILFRHP